MNISKLFVAAIFASAVAASVVSAFAAAPESIPAAAPAAPAAIRLSGVTGIIQIKTPGGVMTVKKGEPMPDIPAGAEIIVVTGEVAVVSGGLTVNAKAGDSFTVNTGAAGFTVAVTGGSVSVVDAKGVTKSVAKGESTTAAAVAATVVTKTETKTATKSDTPPAETVTVVTIYVFTTSSTQESTNSTPCINTSVSPSVPC